MEEINSILLDYQEQNILELKHKLLCTMFELESARAQAKEEMAKNEENVNQLLELLTMACQERDEARNQLQAVSKKVALLANPPKLHSTAIRLDNSSGLIYTGNTAQQTQPMVRECREMSTIDPALAVIDSVVKGKPLPQKGKLLQAVIEAGPLLQTLLLAGSPLPRWQKPPLPLYLPIPEVAHQEGDHGSLGLSTGSAKFCNGTFSNSNGFSPICSEWDLPLNKECPLSNSTNVSSMCNGC